jgi:signal transduction histidine kinase
VNREVQLAETRSNFVSAVSHELKTPLATIRMFADTLRMGRPSREEAKVEYLDTIVNESERLSRLLNNVLDFSKIERGTKTYRREPQPLSEILRSTVRAMEYPAEQHGFQIHVHMEEGVPPVPVDRDAIEQAILNLLANAMKYSGESRDIDLRLERGDGQAVIEVTDRGIGIEEEERERIFLQFYRIPSTENQLIPGTGLGLTLVRHIVDGHEGGITVDSALGEGSTFAIHLPLEADEALEADQPLEVDEALEADDP